MSVEAIAMLEAKGKGVVEKGRREVVAAEETTEPLNKLKKGRRKNLSKEIMLRISNWRRNIEQRKGKPIESQASELD